MRILELWRFPIKGFGGSQGDATLATDGYFPHDRYFAISTGGQRLQRRLVRGFQSTFSTINVT